MQNTIYTLTQKSGKYNYNFDKTGTIFTFQGLFIACKKYLSILHICLFTFCAFEAFTLCNYPLLPNPLPAIQKYRPGRTGKTGNSNVWIIMARDPPVLLRLPPPFHKEDFGMVQRAKRLRTWRKPGPLCFVYAATSKGSRAWNSCLVTT